MDLWLRVLLAIVLCSVPVGAVLWGVRVQRETWATWEGLARRFGLGFEPAPASWLRTRSPRIHGSFEGVPVEVARVVRGAGRSRHSCTRVTAGLPGPGSGTVFVRRRRLFNRARIRGVPRVEVGSGGEGVGVVYAQDAGAARALLTHDVQRTLASFPRRVELDVEGAQAALEWRGLERDPAVLERGLRLIALVGGVR